MKTYPKKQGLGMALTIIIIAAAVIVGGFFYIKSQKEARDAETLQKETATGDNRIEQEKSVYVELKSQNNSGQDGNATIVYMDGKAKVVITIPGGIKDIAQPAHIHIGICPNPGAVKYPLTNVVNGMSETILDIPVEQILSELPLAINIHKSASESKIYSSCGDIPQPPTNEPMIEKGEVKTFNITARSFAFSQTEIRVKKGDTVKINFESTDGFHDWTVDGFNAKTSRVDTGGGTSVEFVANKAGTFEYYCSVGSHRQMGMAGKLIVE